MDLAATLGACVVGIELCGELVTDAVCRHRSYPRVSWEVARDRMNTGDLVTVRGTWADVDALVLRDVSGVLYALTTGHEPVPLAAWLRRRGAAQCCWRPLHAVTGETRAALHRRLSAISRPREHPFATLVRAGVLSARASTVDLVNCNTAPGYRYEATMAVRPSAHDLERA